MTVTADAVPDADPWRTVPGQTAAVTRLRAAVENPVHAYLFVGPEGSGKRAALRAFAGELFAHSCSDPAEAARHRHLAAMERHPDLVVIEPEGAVFRGGRGGSDGETEASVVIREAHASPVEADRKVVAALGFDAANDAAIGALLKTIEEPPARTTIVLLSRTVPPNQSAVQSRCVRIDFTTVDPAALGGMLLAQGVDPERADLAVASAGGNLDRARLLATDERLGLRIAAWRSVPSQLDGTGATSARLVGELRAMLDDALTPVTEQHAVELTAFDDEVEAYGMSGVSGRRRSLVARHKRIERSSRSSELRLGCTILARAYLDAAASSPQPGALLDAAQAISRTSDSFALNPNEELALVALFWSLPRLDAT